MIDQNKPLRKGDIVKNNYAGERNPHRFLLYLGKGTVRQGRYTHKTYDCIAYDGRKVQFFREDAQFEYIGHMDAYDTFLAALRKLNRCEEATP